MSKIRVLLVDDHHLFREGLANILNTQLDFEVVGEAGDGLEALIKARQLVPDLILMDVGMPGCDGLEATQRIKQEFGDVTIVMLTVRDENEKLFEAIRNGAQGYLLKSIRSREMLNLLRGAVRGKAAITPSLGGRMLQEFRRVSQRAVQDPTQESATLIAREQDILSLVAEGATNKEIADALDVSIHTVKSHMTKILAKLHLDRRHEAASFALREGLISPSGDMPR
ncbi:MAG: response regulator transcription factor [Anaerolineae bacterium]|nr:response regulator transcription factor [Anaerolineae bacterium]